MSSIFHSFFVLAATQVALSVQFQLEPENVVVLRGTNASFNSSLTGQWQVMTWFVQKLLVLTIQPNSSPSASSSRFTALNYSTGDISRWEFTIHNVSLTDSGPVTCFIQGDYGDKTSQLSVQESGTVDILEGNLTVVKGRQTEFHCVTSNWFPQPNITWLMYGVEVNTSSYNTTSQGQGSHFSSSSILSVQAARNTTVVCQALIQALNTPQSSSIYLLVETPPTDWTVLIALVTSIGGFALLVLLILGVIFCWKRREAKKSSYHDELRRARTQSTINTISDGSGQGSVNRGYITDGQTGVTASESNDSGYSPSKQLNGFKMPDVYINQSANYHASADKNNIGIRKPRLATIV